MPYAHRLQGSRYELKYLLDEPLVRPLRDFARSYLQLDEHADPRRGNEYEVHSLYLDSPALKLCRATLQGQKNRFKLRIRFYDFRPESPVFFEVKRRVSDVILKQRAAVRRDAVDRLLAGQWPSPSDLAAVTVNGKDFGPLQRFCSLRDIIHAEGMAFVSYLREAYVTPDSNAVRMTFDRAIRGTPYRKGLELDDGQDSAFPPINGVVLELKFTDRFPKWMRTMVEIFGLERLSMAKYVKCVLELAKRPGRLGAPLLRAGKLREVTHG